MTPAPPEIDFAAVLASTVHDMKNSLCMLIQSTELIQQESGQLSEPARDELARLNYEANRLNSNLLQLLALDRLGRQRLPVQVDQYYLSDVVEEILLKNQFYTEQRGFTIYVEQPDQLAWFFDYDLILNLLNDAVANALRYGKNQILLRFFQHNGFLQIEVHDDGPGFPSFMLECETPEMNTPDLTNNHTGLGIFFAKLIAKAHTNKGLSGAIELVNGSRFAGGIFRVMLP